MDNIDDYNKEAQELNKQAAFNIGSSAASGAAAGTSIAPGIGTAIGAAVGGLVGVVTSSQQKKQYIEDQRQAFQDANASERERVEAREKRYKEQLERDKLTTQYIGGRSSEKYPIQEPTSGISKKGNIKQLRPITSSVSPFKMKASEAEKIRKFNSISHKLPEMNAGDVTL